MTKSISRRQVRLIVSSNAIFGVDEACAMLRISCDAITGSPICLKHTGTTTRPSSHNTKEARYSLLHTVL